MKMNALPLILALFLCTLLPSIAPCQDSLHRPGKFEIGLRSDRIRYSSQMNTLRLQNQETNRADLAAGIEGYGMWFSRSNFFLRASIGMIRHHSYEQEDLEIPMFSLISTLREESHSWLTSSLAFGKEFTPFTGRFSSRFFIRAGLGLNHSYLFAATRQTQREVFDTLGATAGVTAFEGVTSGVQNLQFNVFGQAGFKIWKGLSMNLEWKLGPNMVFGRVRSVQTNYNQPPGLPANFTTQVNSRDSGVGIEFRNLRFTPFLSIGWNF